MSNVDLEQSFADRFGKIMPKNEKIRERIIETGNKRDFFIDKSCFIVDNTDNVQLGLFAKRGFTKGMFLGTYRGILCNTIDLHSVFSGPEVVYDPELGIIWDRKAYNLFIEKYSIQTNLTPRQTCNLMVKLGFAIGTDTFLVMPRYPVDPVFYQEYNAMLFVNEPPNCTTKYNPFLQKDQPSEINVLAFTNYKWNTIDYIAAKDIEPNEELLVYYGNRYQRNDYAEGVSIDGCNRDQNRVFF